MDRPIVDIRRLTKYYDTLAALDGLTLSVPRGSIFGFLGTNGAGKTTTINILLGLVEPSEGAASVLGFDIVEQSDEIRTRVGALLDETGLYEQMSAYENLWFYARAWRLPKEQAEARVKRALSDLGLWDRRHDLAGSWSRGMQQRLALARAQLHDPELLFLDEPTAGLDVVSAREVRDQLAGLVDRGRTIFLTTHNMTEAEELCDRVAIIHRGRLLAEGHPDELLSASEYASGYEVSIDGANLEQAAATIAHRPDVISCVSDDGRLRLRLTTPDPSPVLSELILTGASIHEVRRGTHLEDAFLELVREDS